MTVEGGRRHVCGLQAQLVHCYPMAPRSCWQTVPWLLQLATPAAVFLLLVCLKRLFLHNALNSVAVFDNQYVPLQAAATALLQGACPSRIVEPAERHQCMLQSSEVVVAYPIPDGQPTNISVKDPF